MTRGPANASTGRPEVAVVLVEPRDGANVGAVARAMKNCGFADLRLVGARRIGARARRTAVHAEDVLGAARRFETLEAALEGSARVAGFTARRRRFGPPLELYTGTCAAVLRRDAARRPVALVFGPEDSGLTDEHVQRCTELYRIAASASRAVYNLAQAVLLAIHPIAFPPHGRGAPALPAPVMPPQDPWGTLGPEFERALAALGYPPAARPHDRTARILARLRVQMRRACQDPDDRALWRGLLARIRGPADSP